MNPITLESAQPCSLARRCAALIYDGLILVAVWIVGSGLVIVPLNAAVEPGELWFQAYLACLTWAYFASGWLMGGQTIGMRAWKMILVSSSSNDTARPISLINSMIRVLVGAISLMCFGLGFIWSVFRKDRAGWHDLASQSRLLVVDPSTATG